MAVDTTEAAEAARQAMGGIGVSLARKEDARFIHGQGHYVDDVVLPGMLRAFAASTPARRWRYPA
jgi:carbon-monoxide dehydrogenase large subunit